MPAGCGVGGRCEWQGARSSPWRLAVALCSRGLPIMGPGICASGVCDVLGLAMTVLQLGQFIPQHVEMVRFWW